MFHCGTPCLEWIGLILSEKKIFNFQPNSFDVVLTIPEHLLGCIDGINEIKSAVHLHSIPFYTNKNRTIRTQDPTSVSFSMKSLASQPIANHLLRKKRGLIQ